MTRSVSVVTIMILMLLAVACSPASSSQPVPSPQYPVGTYQTLTVDALADILANHLQEYTIVNVHIPYAGEIEGTSAKIPYNDINTLMTTLPDKNAPIILYCRSGRMSKEASLALLEQGYTRIWDVEGGMDAWVESSRSLIYKE
ncbi:MAG: rhodanese-like domain-containing protein [Anaerolineae bacterium]